MTLFRAAKPKGCANLSADTVMAAGQNVIPLNTLLYSEGDIGWAGGPGFTVGRPGLYLVIASLARAAVGTAASLQVRVFVNGGSTAYSGITQFPSSTSLASAQRTACIPLAAGDLVELAGTLHGTATATAKAVNSMLTVVRIGPERWTG